MSCCPFCYVLSWVLLLVDAVHGLIWQKSGQQTKCSAEGVQQLSMLECKSISVKCSYTFQYESILICYCYVFFYSPIAFFSGLGVALSVVDDSTSSLVGVAISASLLPPAGEIIILLLCIYPTIIDLLIPPILHISSH